MKRILLVLSAILSGLAFQSAVYAEEAITPLTIEPRTTQVDCEEGGQDDCVVPLGDEPAGVIIDEPDDDTVPDQVIINDPILDESEALENEDDEEAEESDETWTMYVSLGALGAAILVFIILNLASKRKK